MEYVKSSAAFSSVEIGENQQQQSSSGSFVATSFGRRWHCWICTDVWMDIFPLFGHAQLGLKLALLSPRFDVLVDTHFDGKSELTVWRSVEIRKETQSKKAILLVRMSDEGFSKFALPDSPLPNKIRFNSLVIEYIDHSVITFLRSNKHIFARGTKLYLDVCSYKSDNFIPIWDVLIRQIVPVFPPNIRHLCFPTANHLFNLRRFISPSILTDLKLSSIKANGVFPDGLGNSDGIYATAGHALSKWLHTPRTDGQPKKLSYGEVSDSEAPEIMKWINAFKEAFVCATVPAKYIVKICLFDTSSMAQFESVNKRTNEMLTLQKHECYNYGYVNWLLKRCPIGETINGDYENSADHFNGVNIHLHADDCIGPLSPPTESSKAMKRSFDDESEVPIGQQKKKK